MQQSLFVQIEKKIVSYFSLSSFSDGSFLL